MDSTRTVLLGIFVELAGSLRAWSDTIHGCLRFSGTDETAWRNYCVRFADSRRALPHWRSTFWIMYWDDVLLQAAGGFGRYLRAVPC
jgi:hypothetical protein